MSNRSTRGSAHTELRERRQRIDARRERQLARRIATPLT
jgi:hypothetical protein